MGIQSGQEYSLGVTLVKNCLLQRQIRVGVLTFMEADISNTGRYGQAEKWQTWLTTVLTADPHQKAFFPHGPGLGLGGMLVRS